MCLSQSAIKTAVVYSAYGSRASYYDDWQDAFSDANAFLSTPFNIAQNNDRKTFIAAVQQFELIVLLHSVNADNLIYAKEILPALQSRKGRLFSFVGNELSLPGAPLVPKIAFLKEAETDIIATQLLKEAGDYLYSETGAQVAAIPHALNPKNFQPRIAQRDRSIDVGVRSFRYPTIFLGDNDRNRLLDLFTNTTFDPALNIDIRTDQRFERVEWASFLNSCKSTISNEAGSHWIDKDDTTTEAIKCWLKKQSGGGAVMISSEPYLRRLVHKLPWGVRQWLIKALSKGVVRHEALIGHDADFDEVYELFHKAKPFPPKITGKCISSRHFDAAGTQTCQIMIEGRYSDILAADVHYIPVAADFSNIEQALEKFRDEVYRTSMVKRTHDFILSNHTYVQRMGQVEALVRAL